MVQGIDRARSDEAQVHDRLLQTTRTAAGSEENLLGSAEQILRALANLPAVRDADSDCNRDLASSLRGLSFFTNIARLNAEGAVTCAALPNALGRNAKSEPVFEAVRKSDGFVVSGEMMSPVLHRPVIAGMLPLRDVHHRFYGALAIAIDVRWLDFMMRSSQLPRDSVVALIDSNHHVIASDNTTVAKSIFANADSGSAYNQTLQGGRDAQGRRWSFATAPLIGQRVFVGFAMREATLFSATYIHVGTDFILPFLMIALTWLAIWVVTEQQVTRWIDYLKRISIAYRTGHYTIRPQLDGAPSDFRALGGALADMADAIQERDKSLRDAVKQKTVLIKEIHHRVKNNLQIVMSLLSIQANQVKDPTARDALTQAQTRINALALVHRILNELEDQSTLDLRQLLDELSRQIAEGIGNAKNVRVEVDVPHMIVSSNVAVAVALFTVEALTNIFKHAFPRQAQGVIRVRLASDGEGRLKLSVTDDGIGFSMDDAGRSVGSRLIRTFGAQLGGVSSVRSDPGKGTVVELVFPDPTLKEQGETLRTTLKSPAAAAGE
jgi:two-component sensor histidine kinase